uniref:Putative secreted protein n=1 Tax=Ixodes ricinus TaxID=34613 RepID=A0A6B0TV08_IXORI
MMFGFLLPLTRALFDRFASCAPLLCSSSPSSLSDEGLSESSSLMCLSLKTMLLARSARENEVSRLFTRSKISG